MSSRPANFAEDTFLEGFGLNDQSDERWHRRERRRRRANGQQYERQGSSNSSNDEDLEAAVVDSLTDEVVSQMQLLSVERSADAAVARSGGNQGRSAIAAHNSLGSGGGRSSNGSSNARDVQQDMWNFLDNAAQVFGNSPELKEVVVSDIRNGYDPQGYNWRGKVIQKEVYVGYRKRMYPRYQDVQHNVKQVRQMSDCIDTMHSFYDFRYSAIGDDFRCQIGDMQHRDMLWATSSYDVYYSHAGSVYCWNPWQRLARRRILDRSQMPRAFRMRSMCVDDGVVFVGDSKGDYCVKSLLADTGPVATGSLAAGTGVDAIRHASPTLSRSGALHIVSSHQSGAVRRLDACDLSVAHTSTMDWAANCSSLAHDGTMQCVVGNSTDAQLVDPRRGSDDCVARLTGHLDYSFSCALSPDGRLVATGSQDTSVRVYDVRWPHQTLATLGGYVGAMHVVKFSQCGRFLLGMESADYVHMYDVQSSFKRAQVVGLMGETAGAAFSPDSNCLFLSVSDPVHGSSLAEYNLVSTDAEETPHSLYY
ncbi:hypothetical protein GGH99_001095 [Coemansia sp. RSA 1285]|nr:hypothetical protein GGH99_001095 [Coemansia sp. RSA 1285]